MRNVFCTSRASIATGPASTRARLRAAVADPLVSSEIRSGASKDVRLEPASPAAKPPLLEVERVREARVGRPRPRFSGPSHAKWDQPPPENPADQLGLAAERLIEAGETPQRAGHQPRERQRRPRARDEAPERPALRTAQRGGAPDQERLRLHLAREVPAEVRGAPAAEAAAQDGTPPRGAVGRGRGVGASGGHLTEHRAAVLHVVVERAIDVRDLPDRQRYESQPVVVELKTGGVRERERELGDVAAEQHGRGGGGLPGEGAREGAGVVAP